MTIREALRDLGVDIENTGYWGSIYRTEKQVPEGWYPIAYRPKTNDECCLFWSGGVNAAKLPEDLDVLVVSKEPRYEDLGIES